MKHTHPCNTLPYPQRIERLASYLWSRPDALPQAGICQVCGHTLPVAYRSVQVVDRRVNEQTGRMRMKVDDAAPGSDGAKRLEDLIAARRDLSDLFANDRLVMAVAACDRLDEDVWRAALRANVDRRREETKKVLAPTPRMRSARRIGELVGASQE